MDDNIIGNIIELEHLDGNISQIDHLSGNLNSSGDEQTVYRGYSAYEIALQQGFEGSKDEWLRALVGPQGETGVSISDVRLNPDFTLTITLDDGTEFTTDSIKGDKGDKGQKGDKGDKGDIGTGISFVRLNDDYTLTIIFSDGSDYKTHIPIRGEKGQQGVQGIQGPKGDTGERGPQGQQGIQGVQGPKGQTGQTGPQGETGPAFTYEDFTQAQLEGLRGPQGQTGPKGDKGQKGDTGQQGLKGDTGQKGEKGDTGSQGPKGDSGPKGDKGQQGIQGQTGAQGQKGETGDSGVYIGTDEPTDENIKVWISNDSSTDSGTVESLVSDVTDLKEELSATSASNNLMFNREHGYINYNYDEPCDRPADTTATSSLRVGVKRYNNMVVLNYDGGLSSNPVIRISDSVQSAINNNVTAWNTGGVSLVAGKKYKVTMIRTDAPYEQLVSMSVYRLGEKNSVGVGAYTESGYVRAFTAEEGKAYNICMYIQSNAVLENATYLITLEEDTVESLYIPYIEEKLTADDFMNGYKDLVTDSTHTSTSRLCNKFIRSAKKGDIITYRSPTLQLGIWTVYASDTEPTAVRSYATSPVNESFVLPKDVVEILFQLKKSSGSISVSDYNCDISIFRQTAENVKPHSNIRSVNHRGFQELAPENTLEAFKQSAKHGFKWIETDVQFTSDGVPVILHDRSINRTARNADGTEISGTVNIDSITYEQALSYDFGIWFGSQYAGTKIPTFEEMIALCQKIGLKVRIELKSETVTTAKIPILVGIVQKYGMVKNVEWASFGLSLMQYIAQEYPSYDLGYIVSTVTESAVASATALKTPSNNVLVACPLTSTDTQIQLLIDADIPMDFWTVTKLSEILSASPYATSYTTNRYYVEDVLSGLGFASE